MGKNLTVNPWLKIWLRPRETMREIVSFNPKHRFFILSALYGFPMLLHAAQNLSLGKDLPLATIMIVSLVLAVFIGMAGISIASFLLLWTGKWIGGRASYYPIRAAVSWSNVPNVIGIVLWLILVWAFRRELFLDGFSQTTFVGKELGIVSSVFILQTVISIWSLVILVKGLGEVQGFSAWKGLLNVLIPFFLVGIFIWFVSWVIWACQGMPTG